MKKRILNKLPWLILIVVIIGIAYRNNSRPVHQSSALEPTGTHAHITYNQQEQRSTFLFTTCGGKVMIIAGPKEVEEISKKMLSENNYGLYNLGLGNAFFMDLGNKESYLCTANHVAIGLEKYSYRFGSDICFVAYKIMSSEQKGILPTFIDTVPGYHVNFDFDQKDSLFIKGYLPYKNGKVQSLLISGIAAKVNKEDIPDSSSTLHIKNGQFMQKEVLLMKMDDNIDLGGLSGAPAFNKQGEVVGVYSGRNMSLSQTENGYDTTYFIRVSLFRK